MQTSKSPLFLLQTEKTSLEVVRFTVSDWGISRHYRIDLCVNKPDLALRLGESLTLKVDELLIHGVVQKIDQIMDANKERINLTLISPLAAKLNRTQSRVYSQQTLSDCIKQFLTESGLIEGLDFELRLKNTAETLWIQQDEEHSLSFFNRLMAMHALVYTMFQQEKQALCIISDSLDKLPEDPALTLTLMPPSGLNQQNEISDLSMNSRVCSQSVAVYKYNEKNCDQQTKQSHSIHSFAKGHRRLNGYLSPGITEALQAADDEQSEEVTFICPAMAKPGQQLNLQHSPLASSQFKVRTVKVVGVQEPASGALPVELQQALHHSRLQFHLTVSPALTGKIALEHWKPVTSFKTAKIEHREGLYADISEQGAYHARLQSDEHPEKKAMYACSAKTKASPWLRNALYYAGNNYGFSHPFQDGSEVILAFENGHSQHPLIIGALANKKAQSVVRAENSNDSIISSSYGSCLLFKDEVDKKQLALALGKKHNHLSLQQSQSEAEFYLKSGQGELHIQALEHLNVVAKNQYKQCSKEDQHVWIKKAALFHSEKGHLSFEADQSTSIHSERESKINAKRQHLSATDTMNLRAVEGLRMKADKMISMQSEQGRQDWRSSQGSIYLKATESLTLKAAGNTVELKSKHMRFSTQGILQVNAPEIHGLG